MAAITGEEVFHYHSKLVAKQPHTGGVFQWHQDYGYWYKNGHLTPDMCTVFIAVDRCDTENGCIEVPDIEIKKCDNISDLTGKEFMDVRDDKTIVAPDNVSRPTQDKV
ncbi:hypothetical protein EB796_011530 [Bugula neritina]|uniref:Uncharacterized protein n=1 Tax=Bugula neritina TaxID=10212 RepID=A0A7J7JUV7_BUGNE|nr:hypothetical protein EB796_011530 [Bugula neritina]